MNPRTILTCANGQGVDLLDPKPSDFSNLEWAAEHLAKENRFNGATPGIVYSVAQHQVEGATEAFEATSDKTLAAYVSLHDVHESLFKDDTTPKKRAFAALAEQRFGVLASEVMATFDELTDRCDAAVHAAAGLAWPPSPEMAAAIKHYDRVMLVTEWRDLMGGFDLPAAEAYADVTPLRRRIVPLNKWQSASFLLCETWRAFLPVFTK